MISISSFLHKHNHFASNRYETREIDGRVLALYSCCSTMLRKNKYIIFLLIACVAFIIPSSPASATDESCRGPDSYTASLDIQTGGYAAYARLSKRGEQAAVTGYMQSRGCEVIGKRHIQASGDYWTYLGNLTVDGGLHTLALVSSSFSSLPDANRPSLMLVPRDSAVCTPARECEVTVDGQKGYVRPAGTLLNQDLLHVVTVKNPAEDSVERVAYYIDDKLVYTAATLGAFNLRYVQHPGQSATRIVEYESGQRIILPYDIPSDHTDSFGNFLFRLTKAYPKTTNFVIFGLGLLLVVWGVLWVVRMIRQQQAHRRHHGLVRDERSAAVRYQYIPLAVRRRLLAVLKIGTITICSVAAMTVFILGVDRYVAQIFFVDGVSMQKGMATGDQVFVNRLPKTLADFNNREYIPKRGDIVITHAAFGVTAVSEADESTTYIIKRVIGLPGERVVIKDGVVVIYNTDHPDGFIPDKEGGWTDVLVPNLVSENLDLILGESELFVSGDNRPESIDSRYNGPIELREIIGKVEWRIWPLGGKTNVPENVLYQ